MPTSYTEILGMHVNYSWWEHSLGEKFPAVARIHIYIDDEQHAIFFIERAMTKAEVEQMATTIAQFADTHLKTRT
jgi:hypothetical protein